mgnify:CR=1 FL=1
MRFSHILVIGGTGMLAAATRQLASCSEAVTLVARQPEALDGLECEQVERIAVDYHRSEALLDHLGRASASQGAFDLALTWVHGSADTTLGRIAEWLATQAESPRLVDVQGSAAGRPGGASPRHRRLSEIDGVVYQRVILGFVIEDGRSRWLTHDEISAGVLDAVASGVEACVVGVVEPWDSRP